MSIDILSNLSSEIRLAIKKKYFYSFFNKYPQLRNPAVESTLLIFLATHILLSTFYANILAPVSIKSGHSSSTTTGIGVGTVLGSSLKLTKELNPIRIANE